MYLLCLSQREVHINLIVETCHFFKENTGNRIKFCSCDNELIISDRNVNEIEYYGKTTKQVTYIT